ncbi:MAG: Rpn family recombination-promoting nuclease/putative transposase [Cyanobacteriota bacterium]|nr:Rpn family recombination-promoting nuclease/putative transposase [Cyanobacteriota bacterium]
MRFINPKTDFAFKKIFGSSESKDILISFLNALIYDGEPTIEDLEILDPYLSPQFQGLKDTYLDVKAKLNNGTIVIIEMQVLNVESFEKRILYNAAKAYSLQLTKGRNYRNLQSVIALTITDFVLFADLSKIISHFVFKERETHLEYIENGIELIFVELPKFLKQLEELENLTDQWLYFMKSAGILDSIPDSMGQIPEIRRAFTIANQANLNEKELEELEKQEIWIQDRQGELDWVMNEGRAQGRADGRAQGRAEGRAQGRAEGRAEGEKEKAIAIARQLLGRLDPEAIAQTTGLSLEDIQALEQND